ncbi:hypothetical protein F5X96DRAFT_94186 [Biscogniauxia mediterranea]|nr:hypothetical protein F5X96DRAFT_94186 [Biscogniauxia mediterranea]
MVSFFFLVYYGVSGLSSVRSTWIAQGIEAKPTRASSLSLYERTSDIVARALNTGSCIWKGPGERVVHYSQQSITWLEHCGREKKREVGGRGREGSRKSPF